MAYVKLGAKAEGSIVKLNEDGAPVEFYVAKQDYEPELNGAGRVLLVRKECYDQRKWHHASYRAYYAGTDIDVWINGDYKSKLDPDIQAAMGTTKFYSGNISSNIAAPLERSVFLLSATELGRSIYYQYAIVEGTALSSSVIDLLKIAYLNGSAVYQWTRTAYTATNAPSSLTIPSQINGGSTITVEWGAATDAEDNLEGYKVERSVDGGSAWTQIYQGGARSTANLVPFGSESVMYRVKAYDTEGLESAWKTSAQVTVINNTAPTAPGSITVPEQVQGGQPLAVSWGASSDSENNLTGYSLERQVDGGDWAAVYSGNELSFTDSITKGWQTVAYRVRAFDQYSAYSGFTTSETREVNNNTPPVITCEYPSGTLLGVKNEDFAISYSVADEEGDEVAVTESVDGAVWRTFTAELARKTASHLLAWTSCAFSTDGTRWISPPMTGR